MKGAGGRERKEMDGHKTEAEGQFGSKPKEEVGSLGMVARRPWGLARRLLEEEAVSITRSFGGKRWG